MLGKFWVKGPSGLSRFVLSQTRDGPLFPRSRWQLVLEGAILSEPSFISTQTWVTQLGCDRTDQSLQPHLGLRRVGQTGHQPLWTPRAPLRPRPLATHLHQLPSLSPPSPSAGPQHLSCMVVACHRLPAHLPGQREERGAGTVQATVLEPETPGNPWVGCHQRVARPPATVHPDTDLLSFPLKTTPLWGRQLASPGWLEAGPGPGRGYL